MKLPASVPPPIELNDGLFTLLLSGQTTERQEDKEQFYPKIQTLPSLLI